MFAKIRELIDSVTRKRLPQESLDPATGRIRQGLDGMDFGEAEERDPSSASPRMPAIAPRKAEESYAALEPELERRAVVIPATPVLPQRASSKPIPKQQTPLPKAPAAPPQDKGWDVFG
ncbi:MAG: hypothetical protein SF028_06005 [Candidatus Sumerlaeia bacterium]|nr:hypothetical protein [Candidatus Sumerlaeia bacterium]